MAASIRPLFVLLAGLYFERTGMPRRLRNFGLHRIGVFIGIDGSGDPDQDGFIEYERAGPQGC